MTRIVPIEGPQDRAGTGQRRQPESNRCGNPVAAAILTALCLLLVPAKAEAKCRTKACWGRVHDARVQTWLREHRPAVYYWRREPLSWRNWAKSTARCESTDNPRAVNRSGPFYGWLQFHPRTWYAAVSLAPAPLRTNRLPHELRREHQGVVGIRWARRYGRQHWPQCGV